MMTNEIFTMNDKHTVRTRTQHNIESCNHGSNFLESLINLSILWDFETYPWNKKVWVMWCMNYFVTFRYFTFSLCVFTRHCKNSILVNLVLLMPSICVLLVWMSIKMFKPWCRSWHCISLLKQVLFNTKLKFKLRQQIDCISLPPNVLNMRLWVVTMLCIH